MNSCKLFLCCPALAVGLMAFAHAEELRDPTRPPAMLAGTGGEQVDDAPLLLQSVLIGPGRRTAIINGQVLQIGARVGEARLVKIEEDRVVLRTGSSHSTLRLFPVVNMKPSRTEPKTEQMNSDDPTPAPKKAARKVNRKKPAMDNTQ